MSRFENLFANQVICNSILADVNQVEYSSKVETVEVPLSLNSKKLQKHSISLRTPDNIPEIKCLPEKTMQKGSASILSINFGIKERLAKRFIAYVEAKTKSCKKRGHTKLLNRLESGLTTLQEKLLLSNLSAYKDLCYMDENLTQAVEVREVLCLHVLNHLTKTHQMTQSNNENLKNFRTKRKEHHLQNKVDKALGKKISKTDEIDEPECLDSGYTKARVLVLLPTRVECLKFMKLMFELMPGNSRIGNKDRFLREFCNPYYGLEKISSAEPSSAMRAMELSSGTFDELDFVNKTHPLINLDRNRYKKAQPRSVEYLNDFETNISNLKIPFEEDVLELELEEDQEIYKSEFEAFKLGICFKDKRRMELFTDFYKSDLIVASPLDLRVSSNLEIGSTMQARFSSNEHEDVEKYEKEIEDAGDELLEEFGVKSSKKRKIDELSLSEDEEETGPSKDFLSSVEMVVISRCDLFLMQNFQHLVDVLNSVGDKPEKMRTDTDFSRIRPYFLEPKNISSLFRQMIVSSRFTHPLIKSLLQEKQNVCGSATIRLKRHVGHMAKLRGWMNNLEVLRVGQDSESLHNYFSNKFIKQMLKDQSSEEGLLIVAASYFDFIRIRNTLEDLASSLGRVYDSKTSKDLKRAKEKENEKKNGAKKKKFKAVSHDFSSDLSGLFASLSEYSSTGKISKVRADYQKQKFSILLVTERFQFYFRYFLTGAKQVLFFGAPLCPEIFEQIVKMVQDSKQTENKKIPTFRLLLSAQDSFAFERLVGTKQASKILRSDETTFRITTN